MSSARASRGRAVGLRSRVAGSGFARARRAGREGMARGEKGPRTYHGRRIVAGRLVLARRASPSARALQHAFIAGAGRATPQVDEVRDARGDAPSRAPLSATRDPTSRQPARLLRRGMRDADEADRTWIPSARGAQHVVAVRGASPIVRPRHPPEPALSEPRLCEGEDVMSASEKARNQRPAQVARRAGSLKDGPRSHETGNRICARAAPTRPSAGRGRFCPAELTFTPNTLPPLRRAASP